MKDPEAERGKRLCSLGTINQIEVDRSAGSPIYNGGLMTPGFDSVRFSAVGSSGDLVEGSGARICGIVTGKYSYSNAGGGTTHAVYLVGMFDIPQNKPAPVPAPRAAAPARRVAEADQPAPAEAEPDWLQKREPGE
jgi:hypothetical protein